MDGGKRGALGVGGHDDQRLAEKHLTQARVVHISQARPWIGFLDQP